MVTAMNRRLLATLITFILLFIPASALAQDYYFSVPQVSVDVYWNADGTETLNYTYVFQNDPSGHAIDYVDVGIPNGNFDASQILADVDGIRLTDISESGFQGEGGSGVAVGLGAYSIPPGGNGIVRVFIPNVRGVLYVDDKDPEYVSAVFKPNYYGSSFVYGSTSMTVRFHLPLGVLPEEPRWHAAPAGFPSEPETGFDEQGNITYTWQNPNASSSEIYEFGASFPKKYIPEETVVKANPFAFLQNINVDSCIPWFCIITVIGIIFMSLSSDKRRRMQYLPPKISIEGHGIKRGLTAVEAAILLEQPLDKILTMILFGVLKKDAAQVITRDPLEIQSTEPLPEGLREYETQFLAAFKEKAAARQRLLQEMSVALIKSVAEKLKGFSRKETIEYYQNITAKAWEQVEAENTPEVRSQKYDEVMEWTMLDREYDNRTRDVFRNQPVFIPTWWGRYDPAIGRSSLPKVSTSPMPTSSPSLPNLPGSDFAASVVNGVQGFSSKVVGNIGDFTSKVTQKTNPVPVSTSSGRSGGSTRSGGGCACACACAGCACACAGGGR
jgi:hypothetical protein